MQLDAVDRKILAALQRDASVSVGELGERVGLSQSQCWRRVERLQRAGIIVRRVAQLDRKKLGLNMQLFAQIRLSRQASDAARAFRAAVDTFPEVIELHSVLGNIDFLLKIVTTDLEAYERFLSDRLSSLPMVQEVHTIISLSEHKGGGELPVALAP
ncbi:Lrp/AsnC family transcriptional regulator [Chitinasiproducens palmae]|uniref:Transcriptional regulator, AsnC family n=1 Tax=Chitinasiproducens palmae TaxID=1770053 RepID=A0A1H2PPL1_9BURK|nr:Lrp/AsnC family transcriptional regulator [Chitinasiproducens palmae]SDV48670.1 transcriptional regulator, AsnC family [Chitinasiproducens palmae]